LLQSDDIEKNSFVTRQFAEQYCIAFTIFPETKIRSFDNTLCPQSLDYQPLKKVASRKSRQIESGSQRDNVIGSQPSQNGSSFGWSGQQRGLQLLVAAVKEDADRT
jgi:hypothetical protein